LKKDQKKGHAMHHTRPVTKVEKEKNRHAPQHINEKWQKKKKKVVYLRAKEGNPFKFLVSRARAVVMPNRESSSTSVVEQQLQSWFGRAVTLPNTPLCDIIEQILT
jgi:hypothetical protein